jgi:hypothetical protein
MHTPGRTPCTLKSDSVFLLTSIRFEYLRTSTIERFVSWSIDHFDFIRDSFELWKVLCVRLSLSVSPSVSNLRLQPRTFHPDSGRSLDGIIAYLTREYDGNVHDRGVVEISASSDCGGSYVPKTAADLQDATYFHSHGPNNGGQWLCYDFKARTVRPTHYSVRAHSNGLLRWVLEGSVEGSSWFLLDQQARNMTKDSDHPIHSFGVSSPADCRYIRLRQKGKNIGGNDYLVILAFEIFGRLTEAKCEKSNERMINFYFSCRSINPSFHEDRRTIPKVEFKMMISADRSCKTSQKLTIDQVRTNC